MRIRLLRRPTFLFAQSSFFQSLFISAGCMGESDSTLLAINHAVITEETARKYFGDENPIGKMLTVDGAIGF